MEGSAHIKLAKTDSHKVDGREKNKLPDNFLSFERQRLDEDKIKEYEQTIEYFARTGSTFQFFNTGAVHAAIVMSTIFKYAKDSVYIYAGSFSGEVSGQLNYLTALRSYLTRGGKINIILERYTKKNKELFSILSEFNFLNPTQITIGTSNSIIITESKDPIHFAVGGEYENENIYRIEEDTKNFMAKGSFNDRDQSKKLVQLFYKIKNSEAYVPILLD